MSAVPAETIVMYSTTWCPDCRRAKSFMKDRGLQFREIIEGKYDDIPEQAFYMVGTIDEVHEKAEKMKAGAA